LGMQGGAEREQQEEGLHDDKIARAGQRQLRPNAGRAALRTLEASRRL
jgi:hypothetical protein